MFFDSFIWGEDSDKNTVFIQSKALFCRYVMNRVFSFQTVSLKLGCGIKNDREMCLTGG